MKEMTMISSFIPHPSSLIPHPSSLILLIPHPSSLNEEATTHAVFPSRGTLS